VRIEAGHNDDDGEGGFGRMPPVKEDAEAILAVKVSSSTVLIEGPWVIECSLASYLSATLLVGNISHTFAPFPVTNDATLRLAHRSLANAMPQAKQPGAAPT
jgi:hypothetical protein